MFVRHVARESFADAGKYEPSCRCGARWWGFNVLRSGHATFALSRSKNFGYLLLFKPSSHIIYSSNDTSCALSQRHILQLQTSITKRMIVKYVRYITASLHSVNNYNKIYFYCNFNNHIVRTSYHWHKIAAPKHVTFYKHNPGHTSTINTEYDMSQTRSVYL